MIDRIHPRILFGYESTFLLALGGRSRDKTYAKYVAKRNDRMAQQETLAVERVF